jgi:Trm5-related predicted tRNA methylase
MSRTVSELAREILARIDRGEALDEALSTALRSDDIDERTRAELETAGLRDAVVHEAFHELLEWHASFGGLAEFLEIDEAIHRTAERIGHDFDQDAPEHGVDAGSRLVH